MRLVLEKLELLVNRYAGVVCIVNYNEFVRILVTHSRHPLTRDQRDL
jgi:hypothetical protein